MSYFHDNKNDGKSNNRRSLHFPTPQPYNEGHSPAKSNKNKYSLQKKPVLSESLNNNLRCTVLNKYKLNNGIEDPELTVRP